MPRAGVSHLSPTSRARARVTPAETTSHAQLGSGRNESAQLEIQVPDWAIRGRQVESHIGGCQAALGRPPTVLLDRDIALRGSDAEGVKMQLTNQTPKVGQRTLGHALGSELQLLHEWPDWSVKP